MKILCFGSLNLDYVYQVDHIVRPGETIAASSYQLFEGGKGLNQAIALGRANASCTMAGVIGRDGLNLLQSLKQSKVNTDLVVVNEDKTGHTIIQVDKSGQNSIIYFAGTNQMITESYIQHVLSRFEPGDYVLLQNEISLVPLIIRAAKQKGLKVAFNPSPVTSDLPQYPLELVDLLILNEIEGYELTREKESDSIISHIHQTCPHTAVLLTLGKDGAVFSDGNVCLNHGIYDVKVVDTTAAGDTFTGYFLACYIHKDAIEDCLRYASIASSLSVSKAGASHSIPYLAEVIHSKLQLINVD